MARPLRLHVPGVACHVTARGNAKQRIFEDDADHLQFLERLEVSLTRFNVGCLAYCLMSNHYHMLLVPQEHSVSRAMQHLNSRYCQWFNRWHARVGHLLQGRFDSRLIDDDSYLLAAIRYIAMNPVRAGLVAKPESWRWGSYRALAGFDEVPRFLAVDRIWQAVNAPDAAAGQARLVGFVSAGDPTYDVMTALLYGGERLARAVDPLLAPHRATRDFTLAERFATRPPLERLFEGAATTEQWDEAARAAFSEHAYTLREIGAFLDRPVGTVWSRIRRSRARRGQLDRSVAIPQPPAYL